MRGDYVSNTVTNVLGVSVGATVAGFAGGVVSLAFVQGLTRAQGIVAVVVGMLTAAYLTPFVAEKFSIAPNLQNGAAFVIGLCAMSIIPIIKKGVPSVASLIAGHYSDPPEKGGGK